MGSLLGPKKYSVNIRSPHSGDERVEVPEQRFLRVETYASDASGLWMWISSCEGGVGRRTSAFPRASMNREWPGVKEDGVFTRVSAVSVEIIETAELLRVSFSLARPALSVNGLSDVIMVID